MRGANKADAAAIQQWISFGDSEIVPASCTWVYPCLGIMQFNKQNTERAKTDIKRALGVLNDFLLTHTYLVGERISLADICLCCNLLALYQMVSILCDLLHLVVVLDLGKQFCKQVPLYIKQKYWFWESLPFY